MINNPFEQVKQCIPEQVLPNPWQTREREDPRHIADLAQSIAAESMLQMPVGRLNAENRVELAFGHSRLAAWKLLNRISVLQTADGMDLTDFIGLAQLLARSVANQLTIDERSRWAFFPVNIRPLNDEEMFRLAVSENLARKDLTPIEEALAMVRYRDEFAKNSAEIGSLFGLSDLTVRGKIRLLKLPDKIQNALRKGDLTEGQARALIPMYDLLLAEARIGAEEGDDLKPSDILEVAFSGAAPVQIAALVARFEKRWKTDPAGPQQLFIDEIVTPVQEAAVATATVISPEPEAANVEELPSPAPEPVPGIPFQEEEEIQIIIEPEIEEEPAAIPAPAAVEPKQKPSSPQEGKPAAVAPQPTPTPAPIQEPVKPLTWAELTITLTLTYWPADGSEQGRAVMAGARLNQGAPKMVMLREDKIELPPALFNLVADLQAECGGVS